MKTKEIELSGKKITIWKMNLGFKNDYKGDISTTTWKNVGGKQVREVTTDNGKMELYTYVYGIYSSEDLGIQPPKDLMLGLTPEEKLARLRIIRGLDMDMTDLYVAISEFNTDADEEVIKKSDSL
jgi:hypothetical protein